MKSTKTLSLILLIAAGFIFQGCFNVATGQAKVVQLVAPSTASVQDNPQSLYTQETAEAPAKEEPTEEIDDEGIQPIPFLPLDF